MAVLMFKEQFADLVVSGQKRQTIRPVRKRPVNVGDILLLRKWSGSAYRSSQVQLLRAECSKTATVVLGRPSGRSIVVVDGVVLDAEKKEAFARADGFHSVDEMLDWFSSVHGLPFTGVLICWNRLR